MSLFKPKDDDYILRGIFLLIAWMIFGLPIVTVLCALVFGFGGAMVGVPLAIALGVAGYWAYLEYGLRATRESMMDRALLAARARIGLTELPAIAEWGQSNYNADGSYETYGAKVNPNGTITRTIWARGEDSPKVHDDRRR